MNAGGRVLLEDALHSHFTTGGGPLKLPIYFTIRHRHIQDATLHISRRSRFEKLRKVITKHRIMANDEYDVRSSKRFRRCLPSNIPSTYLVHQLLGPHC
jgi:hypothetical protein